MGDISSTSEAQAISSKRLINNSASKKNSNQKEQQIIFDFRNGNYRANFFLKGLDKYPVCQNCLQPGNVTECAGKCQNFFHIQCIKKVTKESGFNIILKNKMQYNKQVSSVADSYSRIEKNTLDLECVSCESSTGSSSMNCFVCKKSGIDCAKCNYKNCGKAYHVAECLKYWPQHEKTYIYNSIKSLHCPRHVCHTCVSPDIRSLFHKSEADHMLIKCMLCPGTYHRSLKCIPAGSELLSQTQLICARHQSKNRKRINISHCLFCSQGGSLICCDTCVNSFHQNCLPILVGDHFSCEVILVCHLIKDYLPFSYSMYENSNINHLF